MNTRKLKNSDWDTLKQWWDAWPEWPTPPKQFLPENGTGGLMVEKDGNPIASGFVYLSSNSKMGFIDWIISNPSYRSDDRDEAIKILITDLEKIAKESGHICVFSFTQHEKLIEKHKQLGWGVNETLSHELIKIL